MKTVRGKKWYTPLEVAQHGLIQSRLGDEGAVRGHYNFILELIKSKQLKAKNYSTSKKRAYWLISEEAINIYNSKLG